MPIPLLVHTTNLIEALFNDPLMQRVVDALVNEVSDGIPFCSNETPEGMDGTRFAVTKLIAEDVKNFEYAAQEAKTDRRDLLMAAGFGYSVEEHNRWYQRVVGKKG